MRCSTVPSRHWIGCMAIVAILHCSGSAYSQGAISPAPRAVGPVWLRDTETFHKVVEGFQRETDTEVVFVPDMKANMSRFCDKDRPFDVLLTNRLPNNRERRIWNWAFPKKGKQPKVYLLGQRRLMAIVNRKNTIPHLSESKLREILIGRTRNWKDDGGRSSDLKIYLEDKESWSWGYIARKFLTGSVKTEWGREQQLNALPSNASHHQTAVVFKSVQRETGGIGFVSVSEFTARSRRFVNVVPIGTKQTCRIPSEFPILQPEYPLSDTLYLYIAPEAPLKYLELAQYCSGTEGSAIFSDAGLITSRQDMFFKGRRRLVDMKTAKKPARQQNRKQQSTDANQKTTNAEKQAEQKPTQAQSEQSDEAKSGQKRTRSRRSRGGRRLRVS